MRQFIADKELTAFQTMIIQQGEVIHYDSHGFADVAEGKPLQDNSIFRIASITKCIVAVGIMKLYDQGYFKLEDPIGQYIPEYKNPMVYPPDGSLRPASKPIRIIDVLRHTTGIGKFYPLLREQYNELKPIRLMT